MERIIRYFKNRKGFSIVLLAIGLAVFIMIAGVAIDLSYMYFGKNQLQVAADAAALAGAWNLKEDTTIPDFTQEPARQAAWKFACKNKSVGANTYLVTNVSTNCDNPPSVDDLNSSNSPDGDIVLGNWSGGPDINPTGTPVNAVKVVARRTGETPGMPQVKVFLGKIFKLIGADWSLMSVSAKAIAARVKRGNEFIAVSEDACEGCIDALCTLDPPRILDTGPSAPYGERFAWAAVGEGQAATAPGFNLNDVICTYQPNADVCTGEPLYTSMATAQSELVNLENMMYNPNVDSDVTKKTIDGNGCVTGWWITIPVVDCPPLGTGGSCLPGESGGNWEPKNVWGYASIHIDAICASPHGGPGSCGGASCGGTPCKVKGEVYPTAGHCAPWSECSPYLTNPDVPNSIIVIDAIKCTNCESDDLTATKAVLVR